jgi:hypothetical protein
MLTALSKGVRFRFAIAFAAFAALCFSLPPAVLAMGHGANTMACLSHADAVNHGMAKAHDAAHDTAQPHDVAHPGAKDHSDHAPPAGDHQMSCCGLFCLSAVLVSGDGMADGTALGVPHVTAPAPRLLSRIPDLPERPPNTLLSV